jgi:hypothetical protein
MIPTDDGWPVAVTNSCFPHCDGGRSKCSHHPAQDDKPDNASKWWHGQAGLLWCLQGQTIRRLLLRVWEKKLWTDSRVLGILRWPRVRSLFSCHHPGRPFIYSQHPAVPQRQSSSPLKPFDRVAGLRRSTPIPQVQSFAPPVALVQRYEVWARCQNEHTIFAKKCNHWNVLAPATTPSRPSNL